MISYKLIRNVFLSTLISLEKNPIYFERFMSERYFGTTFIVYFIISLEFSYDKIILILLNYSIFYFLSNFKKSENKVNLNN